MRTNEQCEDSPKHKVSVGNPEKGKKKCIFQPPHNKVKCILCIKESYSKGKKCENFHICLQPGWER